MGSTNGTYLSPEKFKALENELDYLKTTRRKEIAEALEFAKSLGDLSENAEYQEAREAQAELEDRILKIEQILRNHVIVSAHHSSHVEVGTTVVIQKEGGTEKRKWRIVGSEEADMEKGFLSSKSPLGAALIGKKKGDAFTIQTVRGKAAYRVIEIE
jgi:transcription elongation factor GreA